MGLLITIFLIITNIYNSVNAPKSRGLSFIEIWIIGIDFQILGAILQYSYVILLKTQSVISPMYNSSNATTTQKDRLKLIDRYALMISLAYFIIFQCTFWISAVSV